MAKKRKISEERRKLVGSAKSNDLKQQETYKKQ